jgi:hypothetical protein
MARSVTVSFPVIGSPLPDFPCPPDQFLDAVVERPPHWIYHLGIRTAPGLSRSRFLPIPGSTVGNLAFRLGLNLAFQVTPREFVHGELPRPGERSPYAFGLPAHFSGPSAFLALAVGLVACAWGRPLPPTVLFSGCLSEPDTPESLRLTRTSGIADKLLLACGAGPGYNLRPVLNQLYDHPGTARHLGPRELRTQPGQIKLFLIPTDVDPEPSTVPPLAVESLSASLADFGQESPGDVLARVEAMAGDGMLLVQVPSVFHALALLGYQHRQPRIVSDHPDLLREPIRVYRVRHPRPAGAAPVGETSPDAQIRLELAQLEFRLRREHTRDVHTRLRLVLKRGCELLCCRTGEVILRGPVHGWGRALVRRCRGLRNLPAFVPDPGGLLADRCSRPVASVAGDPEHRAALRACSAEAGVFTPKQRRHYQRFLERIQAYVKVPLCRGEEVLGALYLHRDGPGPFDPAGVRVVEALVGWAAHETAAFLEEERRLQEHAALGNERQPAPD